MEIFIRFATTTSLLIALIAGMSYFQPSWAVVLGLDFWRLPEYQLHLERENRRRELLDCNLQKAIEEARSRREILDQLINHQISLLEAVERIKKLVPLEELRVRLDYLNIRGSTEVERLCRLIIEWACVPELEPTESTEDLRQKLLEQLQAAIRSQQLPSSDKEGR